MTLAALAPVKYFKFDVQSRNIFDADMKALPEKQVVRTYADKVEHIGIISPSFSMPSLSRMENLADKIQSEAALDGANDIKSAWLASKDAASLIVPFTHLDIVRKDGKIDRQDVQILLFAGFTGKASRIGKISFVRKVCANGMVGRDEFNLGSVKNTKNADIREAVMHLNLERIAVSLSKERAALQDLANKAMKKDAMESALRKLWNVEEVSEDNESARVENKIDEVLTLAFSGMGNTGETAFDLLNAWTEYSSHRASVKGSDKDAARWESNLVGTLAGTTQRLRELLVTA